MTVLNWVNGTSKRVYTTTGNNQNKVVALVRQGVASHRGQDVGFAKHLLGEHDKMADTWANREGGTLGDPKEREVRTVKTIRRVLRWECKGQREWMWGCDQCC